MTQEQLAKKIEVEKWTVKEIVSDMNKPIKRGKDEQKSL